jgi:hypothetical protein
MKKTMIVSVVLGLLACGQSFAEELTDPDMNSIGPNGQLGDTPNPPWVVAASRGGVGGYNDGASSEPWADRDGGAGEYGLFFKAFTGNPPWDPAAGDVDVDVYQDVPGTPGMKYILTGWWGAEDNWSGFATAGANAIFALDFLNGGGGLIGSAQLDLEAAGLGDPSAPGLNYEQFMVMAVAPAGTATVRARGSMLDGVFYQDPGQALVTDEWSLLCVPEPTSAMLGGLALLGFLVRRR